jgi:hypothetical protein
MSGLVIPRVLHQIWLGGGQLPVQFAEFQRGWMTRHPGWRLRFWTEHNLPPLRNRAEFDASASLAAKANVLRYEILDVHGGVYVDTDFECLRNLEPLLEGAECFVARQSDEVVNNAIIGCVPGHPFLRDLVDSLGAHVAAMPKAPSVTQSGPYYLSRVLRRHPEVTVLPPTLFYPYQWHERWRRYDSFPDAYAVHHYTLSARAAELPGPGAASAPPHVRLLVGLTREQQPGALEWVLEGLCHQTVSGFAVWVALRRGDARAAELLARFQPRLEVHPFHERADGCESDDRARFVFLRGDCIPDPDVVATHAALGHTPVIAYGLRRVYPASKRYRFRAPLDYPGLLWHAEPDGRQLDPSRPPYGDWRDIGTSCFSVPGEVLSDRAIAAAASGGQAGVRRVVRELSAANLGHTALWPEGTVTHLLADEPPGCESCVGGDGAFPRPSVLYSANGSRRPRRTATRVDVVSARTGAGGRPYMHDDYPAVEFVRLSRAVAGTDDASRVAPYPARFQFRVIDPAAHGDIVEIEWHTLRADRTVHDRPARPTLVLRRARRDSHVFLSPPLIVVADEVEWRGDESAERIRRADMSGGVVAEYRPSQHSPPATVTVPVFRRRPDERRRLEALLVNYAGAATSDWAMSQLRRAATALQTSAVRLELGHLEARRLPFELVARGRGDSGGEHPEAAAIRDLLPITPDGSLTVVFWDAAFLHGGAGGASSVAGERRFVFVDVGAASAGGALTRELHDAIPRHATPIGVLGRFAGRP